MVNRLVLVVEGDISLRGLIAEVLQDAGYVVAEAEYGRQVLAIMQQQTPAAILVNHLLPDISGLCLLRQLKDDPATRDIPTILLSGRFHQLADHSVADRVMSLPFDIDALQRQVETLAEPRSSALAR